MLGEAHVYANILLVFFVDFKGGCQEMQASINIEKGRDTGGNFQFQAVYYGLYRQVPVIF